MQHMGQVWHAPVDLSVNGVVEVVQPKAFRRDAVGSTIAGDRFEERHQLIILGFAWSFTAPAAGDGFTIQCLDSFGVTDLHEVLSQAAGHVHGSVTPCYMPLQPAAADSPTSDPGILQVTVAAATNGILNIWGVHTNALGTAPLYQDSPQVSYQ